MQMVSESDTVEVRFLNNEMYNRNISKIGELSRKIKKMTNVVDLTQKISTHIAIEPRCIKHVLTKMEQEKLLLSDIEELGGVELANTARDVFGSQRNVYPFDVYLHLLEQLRNLMLEGVDSGDALEILGTIRRENRLGTFAMVLESYIRKNFII